MSKIQELVRKTKAHISDDGLMDTLYLAVSYIKRQFTDRIKQKADYMSYDTDPKARMNLTPKTGAKVYMLATIPYYDIGGGQRCSQLAKTFHKMGYCVRYLYPKHSLDPMPAGMEMPLDMHMLASKESFAYVREHVTENDLFIFEAPIAAYDELLTVAVEKGCRIIYENIDNWETTLGADVYNEAMLKRLLEKAHLLVGTARPLVDQLERYLQRFGIHKEKEQIFYLANAVDEELFCGSKILDKPQDLVQGSCTLLYYGSLWGEWFDWDLIIGLAKRHPDYAINLIGSTDNIAKIVRSCPENIHFLGLKPQVELPAYLQYVDYALLPFDRGEIGDYVSPLKIFEYIAMYAKVLSTPLPDITDYPNVYFGETVEEWETIIDSRPAVDRDAADAFVGSNSWHSRASVMIRHLYPETETSLLADKLAVVILNYNNKNVIFKCVNTLLRYRQIYGYEIIVVDNGSADGSYELLQQKYTREQILLCRNEKNGCSSGRNLGASMTQKEYILFLDSDQWITHRHWLRPYEDVMRAHPDFGAIGWDGGFFNLSGAFCNTVNSYKLRYMPPQSLCRTDVGYLATDGMLVKRADFEAVQGFDTFYDPTCYEDTDLALKIRDLGRELYYCPYLGVAHLPHQTTAEVFASKEELRKRNREYFVAKWKEKNPQLLKVTK